jgi:hypothetical protein
MKTKRKMSFLIPIHLAWLLHDVSHVQFFSGNFRQIRCSISSRERWGNIAPTFRKALDNKSLRTEGLSGYIPKDLSFEVGYPSFYGNPRKTIFQEIFLTTKNSPNQNGELLTISC